MSVSERTRVSGGVVRRRRPRFTGEELAPRPAPVLDGPAGEGRVATGCGVHTVRLASGGARADAGRRCAARESRRSERSDGEPLIELRVLWSVLCGKLPSDALEESVPSSLPAW